MIFSRPDGRPAISKIVVFDYEEMAGRKVRAPKSSVTVNSRPSKDEDAEPQRRVPALSSSVFYLKKVLGVKRGNLYAEQDQIGPDLGVARPYCEYVSIGTGKVA